VCVMVIEVRRKLVLELNTVNLTYGVWKVMRISPADPYYLLCALPVVIEMPAAPAEHNML
jgi:hypothetical protein